MQFKTRFIVTVFVAFGAGAASSAFGPVHAAPDPAFDRGLVERLVRAEEAQVHALETLVRATEKCNR
jgi:hypothetical protein